MENNENRKIRVAVLISGYHRSFDLNINNLKEKILNKFDYVDIYIHITENEGNEDKYLNIQKNNSIQEIKKNLITTCVVYEPNHLFSKDSKTNSLYNQWSKYYKLNVLKKINEEEHGKYDLVIKYRPDIYINNNLVFPEFIEGDNVYLPLDSKMDKSKLEKLNDNFISDTFAFGSSESMDIYFDIFNNLKNICNNVGTTPETVLYEYLKEKLKITYVDLDYHLLLSSCNVFAICGDSGSGKSTLGNLLKKYFKSSFLLECDRYHKWERGDDNWKNLTHLNPDANYIAKMSNDIFDIKIGKTVYQVDYDHKTGKFTEKEEIGNTNNLIVCGLHSLYNDNKSIYNLRIFIDTDEKLKTKWKINRDVKERGHSLENVLEQINKRKKDYLSFILPQRENSDIIINLYENEESDDNPMSLKILIKKNFDLLSILEGFDDMEIPYQISTKNEDFNIIDFKKFIECKKNKNELLFNNFYDYIIFVILNLKK